MIITLNITEDSKVELVREDACEAVQKESNITILKLNLPATIKGHPIENYTKQIEFGECKEVGECAKFYDKVEGDEYRLCDICTQFKKVMVQFTLTNSIDEDAPIIWKTIPFALEFCESINADQTMQAQATLLSLAEIEKEWQNYIKTNTLRVIYKVGEVPTADAASLGDTIFYLGENVTSPYALTYGHYYRCTFANEKYAWTDLTQDPSIEGVANGIREINQSRTMQVWVGTKEELANEADLQENVMYIPEDHDIKQSFDEVLTAMANDPEYRLVYPIKTIEEWTDWKGWLEWQGRYIPALSLASPTRVQFMIKETLVRDWVTRAGDVDEQMGIQFYFEHSKPLHLQFKEVYETPALHENLDIIGAWLDVEFSVEELAKADCTRYKKFVANEKEYYLKINVVWTGDGNFNVLRVTGYQLEGASRVYKEMNYQEIAIIHED